VLTILEDVRLTDMQTSAVDMNTYNVLRIFVAETSRDSSVGIPKGYGLGGRRSTSGRHKKFFSTSQRPDRIWCPPSLLFLVTKGYLPGAKWPGCEAEHSPPSNVEVKNSGLYFHSPICLHGIMLNQLSRETIITFFTWNGDGRRNALET
jgi:hypothetical protein